MFNFMKSDFSQWAKLEPLLCKTQGSSTQNQLNNVEELYSNHLAAVDGAERIGKRTPQECVKDGKKAKKRK